MNGDPLRSRTSRLTRLYIAALATVAILSITGQVLVQRSLQRQRGDSTVVNIAGRQRMLSQRLTKAVLAWNQATSAAEQAARAKEIRATLELWKSSHASLRPKQSPVVAAHFSELEPIFQAMVSAAGRFTVATETERPESLSQLLQAEPKFLAAMDAIVFQLDREAQARVAYLQRIEWALLSLTLLVLAVEGWLVFRPAVQSIRQAAAALVDSEEQLRMAKEAAESASEQKTRFLATLSHELRNPLHAILGNLELFSDTQLTKEQLERHSTIDSSARSLLGLVSDLLDLACIQAGKLRVTAAPCDLVALGQRCVAMLEPLAESKGLTIHQQVLQELPQIAADPLRIQQVVLNLLGNAVKFTSSGSITLRIGFESEQGVARLEVIDTGPGIPLAMQQTIFAAFEQVNSGPRREQSGVGLGLAISAGLVELMRGRIGVESEVGQGSRFWVELPIGDVAASSEAVVIPNAELSRKLRVLVAEDDVVNRRLLRDFLQVLGHDAVLATDGRTALEQYQSRPCDCVLLDWHMPQLDGLELAQAIRSWEQSQLLPRKPLIAVSAAGAMADEEQARAVGIETILVKPLSLDQLRQALQRIAASKSYSKESPAELPAARFAGALARMQGNRDLFHDVANIFLDQLPEELDRLQQFVADQSYAELARAAHLLRGQGVNFDAMELTRATAELEDFALAGNAGQCAAALLQVRSAAHELQRELRQAVPEPTPAG